MVWECRASHVESKHWPCPQCIAHALRRDSRHTLLPDDCNHATARERRFALRVRTAWELPPRQHRSDEPTQEAVGDEVGQIEQDQVPLPPLAEPLAEAEVRLPAGPARARTERSDGAEQTLCRR